MSLEIHFWNIIVPKKTLERNYPGGIEQFKKDCPNQMYQEDEYLASYSFMNEWDTETYKNRLIQKGFNYDPDKEHSDDFVVLAMMVNGGLWWNVDWIDHDYENCWHKLDNSSNSVYQLKRISELKKCIDHFGELTYKNFISSFKLDENDYGSVTLFESKISALFLLDYFITAKNTNKEFRDNLYHITSTKIQNEFSNKLENKDIEDIIKSRYISYAEIPGRSKERWQQSFHTLLDVNLKGSKNLTFAKKVYPTTLEDGNQHLYHNINFITLETQASYSFIRLIDEIFLGTTFEDSIKELKSIEDKEQKIPLKKKREGCYIATMIYGDYNSEEVKVLRNYRDNKLAKNYFGKTFIALYYFISPLMVSVLQDKKQANILIRQFLDFFVKKINDYKLDN